LDPRSRNLLPSRDYIGMQSVPASFTDLVDLRRPHLRPTNISPLGTSYRNDSREFAGPNLSSLAGYHEGFEFFEVGLDEGQLYDSTLTGITIYSC
jgi:hypothetical protein